MRTWKEYIQTEGIIDQEVSKLGSAAVAGVKKGKEVAGKVVSAIRAAKKKRKEKKDKK